MFKIEPPAVLPERASSVVTPFRPAGTRETALAEILVFSLNDMRFALPADRVVATMPVSAERWEKLARMAASGTLGVSGLPLIRLATRLGFPTVRGRSDGTLVLFGTGGKVRATLLVDDTPTAVKARIETMPAAWREQFQPCAEMIEGVALLPDGEQAAILDLAIGVGLPQARPMPRNERDSAHLLVRAGRAELEAVRVAALRGMRSLDDARVRTGFGSRMLLLLGGEGDAVAVDEIVALAPPGRIERIGNARYLVTSTGRFRLMEPGETSPSTMAALRVLVTAPEGEARSRLRDLVRAMGHDVSLADDPRAARLAGGRFDLVLFDLDAYAEVRASGVAATDGVPRIGLSQAASLHVPPGFKAVVPHGNPVALIAALLGHVRPA